MKTILKPVFACLMASAMLLAPLSQAKAQSAPEPAVVVSIAQLDRQMDTISYILNEAGMGQLEFMVKMQMDPFLKGVNKASPAGIMMFFEDDVPQPKWLAFVPISNMDDVLNTVANFLGEVDEGDDHATIVTDNGQEVVIKKMGDFAYVSDNPEMFKRIPENPVAALGDLPKNYNVAAKLFGQRIPDALREQALDAIRDGYESTLEAQGESLQSDLQRQNFDMQMTQIESFINETKSLTIGMNADRDSGTLFTDFSMVGLKGSELAKRCSMANQGGPSKFSGFLMDGTAFNANVCSKLLPTDADAYEKMLEQLKEEAMKGMDEDGEMSDEEMAKAEKIMDNLFGAVTETLKAGKMDMGAVATLDDGVNFAAGMLVANPGKVEAAVKDAVQLAESKIDEDFDVKLNDSSYKGVTMHKIVIPVPDDEEEARDMFGDTVQLLVGIGPKTVYLAAGSKPMDLLKKSMDAAPKKTQVSQQYNVYLTPILRFASQIEGEEMVEMMADTLGETGKDRIRITTETIENGIRSRFEMQDGILKLIGVAGQAMQGFAPGADDF